MEHIANKREVLSAERVSFVYRTARQSVYAVRDVSYSFERGTVYAIVGKSGCGKTTLISLLAGLNLPGAGDIRFEGRSLLEMNCNHYRRDDVAVIYQNYNLFPLLTVLENVLYPMELQKRPKKETVGIAEETLRSVGLDESYFKRLPAMLSGGEQQRVAIARAIASGQRVILADEPTGNLDGENSDLVMKTFQRLAHEEGYCIIIVTHDPQIADESDVIIRMDSGKIVS